MTVWTLISVVGTQTYTFPAGFVLVGAASVRVHSRPDAPQSNPPGDLRWTTGYIWNNDGDKAELPDPGGKVVSSACYKAGRP